MRHTLPPIQRPRPTDEGNFKPCVVVVAGYCYAANILFDALMKAQFHHVPQILRSRRRSKNAHCQVSVVTQSGGKH